MKQLGLGIIVAIGLTLPAFGQEVFNPPDGNYVLNFAKSTTPSVRLVKSQTLTVTGNSFSATGLDASDKPYTYVFQWIMDGKSRPVTGSPVWDDDAYTQLNPYTVSVTRAKDGKTVQTGISIYNPETKTITFAATDANRSYVLVYEKQ